MATAEQLIAMLRGLVTQTELGNVKWQERGGGGTYRWTGSTASVGLEAVDGDGMFPIRLSIYDANGRRVHSWVTEETTEDGGARMWDDLVRRLWDLVHNARDPVISILKDLDALPPF